MKLGKIFICINILVLSLLMLTGCTEKWPRIIYQNTSYRFDEYNRTIVLDDGYVLDGGHSYDIIETENGYDIIKEQYYKEIDNSITNTTIHACESIEARTPQYQNNYSVTPKDSVSCLFSLENKDNVAVLNFASYKKPGGLYFQGVESQEESLCLESTLLPVIEAFKPTYYTWNNKHLNRGIYLNRALYSKDILFERERQKVYADVITYAGVGDKELREAMLDRINFMLSVAEEHGVQTLILGAWGCGVQKLWRNYLWR
jgi:uncharacterized protein (TIGR02452 family)